MAFKKSSVTVVDVATSVVDVDAVMEFNEVVVDSAATGTEDEVEVVEVVEVVPEEDAAQTSPKWPRSWMTMDFHTSYSRFVILIGRTCNFSLLVSRHRRRMLWHCIYVMTAG
jgi:hypothetical protein